MLRLIFLSRLALVCNVFFLLAVSLQMSNWLHNKDLSALILIIGYFLAGILNPFVNAAYFLFYLLRKKTGVPFWLRLFNFLVLLLQIIYILYLNDVQRQLNLQLPAF